MGIPIPKLERHPINFRKSKSEKSKSLLCDFLTFRNSKQSPFTFQLFDCFKLKMTPFHFLTFRFFPSNLWCNRFTFQLSTFRNFLWLVWLLVFLSENCCLPLHWKNTCSEKDASRKNKSQKVKTMPPPKNGKYSNRELLGKKGKIGKSKEIVGKK